MLETLPSGTALFNNLTNLLIDSIHSGTHRFIDFTPTAEEGRTQS